MTPEPLLLTADICFILRITYNSLSFFITFSGGGCVAKIVATAAVKHLTPITLELGCMRSLIDLSFIILMLTDTSRFEGRSPVIIDPACDLKTATKRIMKSLYDSPSTSGFPPLQPEPPF